MVAHLETPKSEGEYMENFFRQHEKNAPIYPVLVNLMGSLVGSPFNSVVDVGCGHGLLVEAWRTAGIRESYGLEGSNAATPLWPKNFVKYYQIQDLTHFEAAQKAIPKTDVVTTFEVAEHLPERSADSFVKLLVTHRPRMVFFGAATVNQDRGKNPSHVNENTFGYWIQKFRDNFYEPDLAATARLRHLILHDPVFGGYMVEAWWYPKNVWVFVDVAPGRGNPKQQHILDKVLVDHPSKANMLSDHYLNIGGNGEFGELWKRDWLEFGTIFYEEQRKAQSRLLQRQSPDL